jgi:hypothetical protein
MRGLLLAVVATMAVLSPAFAAEPVVGEQRVLVVLATWGPQPFAREEVASAFAEADRFYRKASFDQLSLRGDVTPWLTGYATRPECPRPPFEPGRVPAALTNGPDAAAAAAGYRVESYDRVIYVIPRIACTWAGIAAGRQVVLNDSSAWRDFVHELGHTDGLAHAKAQLCRGCQIDEYGDPFSPMGHGLVDFSAYEKLQMGWIRDVARISRAGSYRIGRPDVLGATPYALVVRTAAGEYWFEQRLDVPTHGLVVRKILPDEPNELEAPPTLLLFTPSPTIGRGETFRVAGVFAARYGEAVRFAWLDRTRPSTPTVSVVAGRVLWTARDKGSGIASCTVALDGRTFARGEAKGSATLPAVKRGPHRVTVACVDRAGNRSRKTVKRIRVR